MTGPADVLHGRPWPDRPVASAWLLDAERPALVLGSTQPLSVVDRAAAAAAGLEVVRRHSGGGAVLLRPGTVVWVDVVVPVADPLWTADVGHAFRWLGQVWVEALSALGVEDARWHDGPLVPSRWSRLVCFAGLGPGEVTVAGRKVVGMSSRRRRDAALFQCAALLRWEPSALVPLLGLDAGAARELEEAAAGVEVGPDALGHAFLAALARR